jgi:macrolide transport system ATP-binding/permease protein
MLLRVDDITKAYGDNQVLNGVSFTLEAGRAVGLVGANGVGKSTLLRIIVGDEEADGGDVYLAPRVEIGYLAQALSDIETGTVAEAIDRALGQLRATEARMRALEAAMAQPGDNLDALLDEYGRASEFFERRGGYDLEHRQARVFAGLSIDAIAPDRPLATLSGGEKSRVGLAALLLGAPDLLILDEPTNHLDFAALAWLEEYLQGYRGGVLVVSHDRQFLNRTVHALVEIDEQTRTGKQYAGNYDFYAEVKAQARRRWEEEYAAQQEEIHALHRFIHGKARQVAHNRAPRDAEKFAYTHKGERVQDAVSRNLRSAEEKLARIEANPIPRPPRPLHINPTFDPAALVNRAPLVADGLRKAYAGKAVLDDVSFALGDGSRVAIVGPNGAGKTTLLRILAGEEMPDAGSVTVAGSAVMGYVDQEQQDLDLDATVLENFRQGRAGEWEEIKAELMGYHLFTYSELEKRAGTLSIGQQRKLQIAILIARRANVLLLDEPTNHISLDVLDEFEQALLAFPGPIIAVSHDRHFLGRFAQEIWQMDAGILRRFSATDFPFMPAAEAAQAARQELPSHTGIL